MNEFDKLVREARAERAVALGEMLGDLFLWFGRLPDRVSKALEVPTGGSLEGAQTAEDVRAYASTIQHTQPSFANELFAAANRSEQPLKSLVRAEHRLKSSM